MEVFRVDSKETKELVFIAAWADAKEDWSNQLALLRKNTHPIAKLQAHFNKYGESDLDMIIVKKVFTEKEIIQNINKCKEPVIETAVIPVPETEKAVIKESIKFLKKDLPIVKKKIVKKNVTKKK